MVSELPAYSGLDRVEKYLVVDRSSSIIMNIQLSWRRFFFDLDR